MTTKIRCAETLAVHEGYVFPGDLNNNQIQFGGRTLEVLDANAGIACVKFLPRQQPFVTAGYDHVQFLAPLTQHDIVTCRSYVTGASGKAVEVFTKIEKTDVATKVVTPAFIAFCSLVITMPIEKVSLPGLIAETDEERYLTTTYPERLKRRQEELRENKQLIAHLQLGK